MKTKIFYSVLALAVLCWSGVQSVQAQYCAAPGCYETGEISCAPACEPSCAPSCGIGEYAGVGCYGDDGCYDACSVGCYGGYCGGGLFAGIGCIVGEAVRIVLTPIHWVASLFCTGTYADCGCAPPYEECYSNPCDMCGNYVGDCGACYGNPYYGYQGYYAANPQMSQQAQDYQYAEVAPKRAAALPLPPPARRGWPAETFSPEFLAEPHSPAGVVRSWFFYFYYSSPVRKSILTPFPQLMIISHDCRARADHLEYHGLEAGGFL